MSLLEDVFLEDEAGEAQELERVIEGDDYDERAGSPDSDDNEVKEDEAEEDKRRVDPNQGKTKRVIKNPRFILNPARLTGPRGIQVIPEHFKDFKFKGKGHEKEDLDTVLKKLEHWAYRLYPKFEFSDCLKKIETLGKKRPVMVQLHKIRNDQITSEETIVQKDSSDDEEPAAQQQEDEFDKLLQQQIELARSTPVSVKKTPFTTPSVDRSLLMPKASSSPSINEEQRERMLRNRKLAEVRRLAKLKNNSENNDSNGNNSVNNDNNDQPILLHDVREERTETQDEIVLRKNNRSNVIDSSSDDEEKTIHESVTVDVHNKDTGNIDKSYGVNSENVSQSTQLAEVVEEIIEIQNENTVLRKHSRSNVIDSSSDDEEMTIHESVTVDVHNKDTGDIDKNYGVNSENVSQSTKLVEVVEERTEIHGGNTVLRKHSRSNVIDSSSDDEEMTIHESVTVDVHNKDTGDIDKKYGVNSENVSQSTKLAEVVEERSEIQDENTVLRKHSRSIVIDSSSDDEEMTINESLSVQVHNKDMVNVGGNDGEHTKNSVEENSANGSSVINDVHKNEKGIDNNSAPAQIIDAVEENNEERNEITGIQTYNNKKDANITIEPSEVILEQMTEAPGDSKIQESSKETVTKDSELCEEIMDVDFEDGF